MKPVLLLLLLPHGLQTTRMWAVDPLLQVCLPYQMRAWGPATEAMRPPPLTTHVFRELVLQSAVPTELAAPLVALHMTQM